MSKDQDGWVSESQETVTGKLQRKMKQSPLVPVGLAGFAVIVAYGLYRLKSRGDMKMSVHLIHTRVAAQACVVGATALGKTLPLLASVPLFFLSVHNLSLYTDKQKEDRADIY
uniref:HIG1 hypoxia-inducible domain family member 1B n=1 Tax=Xenopus tropicalis TaxID=8364 RepID=A0A7D9N0B2_XENTR